MKKVAKKSRMTPMLKESAQQIWLAGLGAFALAGEEGNRLFKNLVKRGEGIEKGVGKAGRERLEMVKDKAATLRSGAQETLGRLRRPLDKGMTTALHRLGVPTRSEIVTLTKRVEALTHAVEKGKDGRHARRRVTKPEPAAAQG